MPVDFYDTSDSPPAEPENTAQARPYVSILFECCNVYARVYRRPDEQVYRGRCPKCLATALLRVGPEGTRARFFRAK